MRRETIGIPITIVLFAVMLLLAYEGIVVYVSDSVLAGFLTNIASILFTFGCGTTFWTFKPTIERALQPKPPPPASNSVAVAGNIGISASATVTKNPPAVVPPAETPKPKIKLADKIGKLSMIALAGFGGGALMIYLSLKLFPIATTATSPFILVPIVSLGGGIFLFAFAIYEIQRIIKL